MMADSIRYLSGAISACFSMPLVATPFLLVEQHEANSAPQLAQVWVATLCFVALELPSTVMVVLQPAQRCRATFVTGTPPETKY